MILGKNWTLDLKSGKIVGTKIISDALLSANYCFMDDENLKNLKKLLSQDQINLSNIIVSIINQAENVKPCRKYFAMDWVLFEDD